MSESPIPPGGMRRTPRQARSQERVNRILDVAEESVCPRQGYAATTTNAIAAQAQVPIGSLYQFFPDKTAILQALAFRYAEKLHNELAIMDEAEFVTLSLSDYVNQLIDTTDRFFSENPSYHAIFMEVQGTMRELEEIEEASDAQLVQDLASSLARRDARLEPADYEAIAYVLVKAISTLLWLALGQEQPFRQRLVIETKRLALQYLQSYFSSELIPANNSAGGGLKRDPDGDAKVICSRSAGTLASSCLLRSSTRHLDVHQCYQWVCDRPHTKH